jgi:hypothetical protein
LVFALTGIKFQFFCGNFRIERGQQVFLPTQSADIALDQRFLLGASLEGLPVLADARLFLDDAVYIVGALLEDAPDGGDFIVLGKASYKQ